METTLLATFGQSFLVDLLVRASGSQAAQAITETRAGRVVGLALDWEAPVSAQVLIGRSARGFAVYSEGVAYPASTEAEAAALGLALLAGEGAGPAPAETTGPAPAGELAEGDVVLVDGSPARVVSSAAGELVEIAPINPYTGIASSSRIALYRGRDGAWIDLGAFSAAPRQVLGPVAIVPAAGRIAYIARA